MNQTKYQAVGAVLILLSVILAVVGFFYFSKSELFYDIGFAVLGVPAVVASILFAIHRMRTEKR